MVHLTRACCYVAGDFEDTDSSTMKIVLSWTYKSFSRGEDSLFSKLTRIDGSKLLIVIIIVIIVIIY